MFCPNCGTKLEGGDSKKLEKWVKDAGEDSLYAKVERD